jgi:mono/diheme cytochrome c family protein
MLKKSAVIAGGVVVVACLVVGGLYLRGRFVAHDTRALSVDVQSVSRDSATLARGNHLSHTMGCRHCHGQNLGGQVFADDPPFRLVAANLTAGRGGVGEAYSRRDWARAIRHGTGPDGRPLLAMPSVSFHRLSDADTQALIAYLRHAPAVDSDLPRTTIRPLGYVLIGAGQIDPDRNVVRDETHPEHVPVGETVAYGRYLYGAACQHCHRRDLEGGTHPDPNGPAVPGLEAEDEWTYGAFARATMTGISVDGDSLRDRWMPWSAFSHLHRSEMKALYRYVESRTEGVESERSP